MSNGTMMICGGLLLVACCSAISRGTDEPRRIVPKCSAQLDPDDNKLILMVCDFSDISVAELIKDVKADVVIIDKSGMAVGSQTLHLTDDEHPKRGGRKYARSFQYASKSASTTGLKVKISSAEAVVVPEVSALGK